jgi:glycine C-acetyltransferase
MGARMMSGNSNYHEQLERELAAFEGKEDACLLNYGYQGMVSIIDVLCSRHDVIVYDAESHACIIDGVRLHPGQRYVFKHNDLEDFEKQMQRASAIVEKQGQGGILVITEGVFGMAGDQGKLKEIVALKDKYQFRLLVDDAHGFGTLGATGAGAGEAQGVQDQIDLYFSTFAKSMASIGAFVAGDHKIIEYIRWNMKGGVEEASTMMVDLRENYHVFASVVVYPVIPKGHIIYRLIPTAVHTDADIEETLNAFSETKAKLDQGVYKVEAVPDMAEAR